MAEKVTLEELRAGLLLSALTEEQLARVAQHARRTRLDEGQMLFNQGHRADRFYLLLKGQLRLFRLSPDGAEKVIELVSPGQTFAEALIFLRAPRYPVCAAALSKAELVAIDADDFARMLRESVDTCFVLLGVLSQRLHALIGEIDNLTLHTATSRVARYLLVSLPVDRSVLELDVRKGVLASRLSIKPETFSRVVKDLSKQRVIEVHGSHITILDHEALQRLAEVEDSAELVHVAWMPRSAN